MRGLRILAEQPCDQLALRQPPEVLQLVGGDLQSMLQHGVMEGVRYLTPVLNGGTHQIVDNQV